MTATPPIFPKGSDATPVSEIAAPKPDPRDAKVARVHDELIRVHGPLRWTANQRRAGKGK